MDKTLKQKQERGERILVTYYPLGDPALGDPIARVGEFLEAGADVLELGLPYKNPSLDGAVVSASMERSLSCVDIYQALSIVRTLRETYPEACLQLMSYYEVAEELGLNEFCDLIKEAGADGVILPNAPAEKHSLLHETLNGLDLLDILFAPISINQVQAASIAQDAQGYVFLQAQTGGTGPQKSVAPQVKENIDTLRSLGTDALLCAGFGISSPAQVHELVAMGADGVIVGSSVILAALEGRSREYIHSLKDALS